MSNNYIMKYLSFCLKVCLIYLLFVSTSCKAEERSQSKWITSGLVPDIIDSIPPHVIELKYGNRTIPLGSKLSTELTTDQPDVVTFSATEYNFYTLLMIDPDAPSRSNPIYGQYLHWFVINALSGDINQGETIENYVSPTPTKFSGFHRYTILAYRQSNRLKINPLANRTNFDAKRFANEYDLNEPIAGIFFLEESL